MLCARLPALELDASGRVRAVHPSARALLGPVADALAGRRLHDALVALPAASGAAYTLKDADPAPAFDLIEVPLGADRSTLALLVDRREVLRLRGECAHLGQLASAGRLISSIVHEINNPLSGIIGYAQLLLMRELDRDVKSALDKIFNEAKRTSRIVTNLLDFARRRPTASTRVPLPALLRKALELKAHDLRVHNVSVHLDLPRTMPAVRGDPHQFLQVAVNLINNAEQAMYEADRGGRLRFRARVEGGEGETEPSVVLEVADSGPGIPEQHREHVFDPFFTTKGEGKGTGIGLGLCREILRHHDATIALLPPRADGDRGAAFELRFRIAPPAAGEKGARRPRHAAIRNRRIVVVEDDPVCRSLVVEAFQSLGNDVVAFDRSEPALRHLEAHAVDAIVSDLHRPGLNGIEFHEQVARIDASLASRILYLSGDTLNEQLERFIAASGNALLSKPVLLRDLHDAMHKLLAGRPGRQKTLFESD